MTPKHFFIALAALLATTSAIAQSGTRVAVATVERAPLTETITLSGSLRAPRMGALTSQVEGYVTAVNVQAGDAVEAGQVLVELDDALPQLELQRLDAALVEARALLADQRRRTDEAQNLLADNNFSRSEFDSLKAEVMAREARLQQIEVQRAIQQTIVERHTIEAPFAGVVESRQAELGQYVSAATPLLRLASMNPLWAEVRLPERYLGQVSAGAPVRLQRTSDVETWYDNRVSRLVPASGDGSRTFLVRSEIDNADWSLAPGMSIRMELSLDHARSDAVLQVPADAVTLRLDGNSSVWVAVDRGADVVAERRAIETGRRAGHRVEITRGDLKVGDRVVVRGNESLRDEQVLEIRAAPKGR